MNLEWDSLQRRMAQDAALEKFEAAAAELEAAKVEYCEAMAAWEYRFNLAMLCARLSSRQN